MKQPVKLGALSLLLAVVVLCLVTLSVLTVATANADRTMALKQADNVQQLYAAEAAAQEWLAAVDTALANGTALPAGTQQTNGVLSAELGNLHGRYISVAVDTTAGTPYAIVRWQVKNGIAMQENLTDLYTG